MLAFLLFALLASTALATDYTAHMCYYDFVARGSCGIVRGVRFPESVQQSCPDLCLVGDPRRACQSTGVACSYGSYVPCTTADVAQFARDVMATSEFSVGILAESMMSPRGSEARPARLFSVASGVGCMSNTNLMIAQTQCTTLVRLATDAAMSGCSNSSFLVPDTLCLPRQKPNTENPVTLVVTVSYNPQVNDLAVSAGLDTSGHHEPIVPYTRNFTPVGHGVLEWNLHPFTVCNEYTQDRSWHGVISGLCMAAGRNSHELCNASAIQALAERMRQGMPELRISEEQPRLGFVLPGHPTVGNTDKIYLGQENTIFTWRSVLLVMGVAVACVFTVVLIVSTTRRCLRRRKGKSGNDE